MVACGDSSNSPVEGVSGSELTQGASKKRVDVDLSARLVESIKDLKDCTETDEGALIYIKDESQFYYCDDTLEWVSIEIKGKDGAKGKDGKDGNNGKDGENGKDGANGEDGKIAANSTIWVSPISGDYYQIVSLDNSDLTTDKFKCPDNMSFPSDTKPYSNYTGGGSSDEVNAAYAFFKELGYQYVGYGIGTLDNASQGGLHDGSNYILAKSSGNNEVSIDTDNDGDFQDENNALFFTNIMCKIQ